MRETKADSSVRLYMREIMKADLLTADEEIKLADRIKRGDEKARETMIRANLRLVVKMARDYSGYGVPMVDLISEGNIGLMKAVERFDPEKGGKLSTYAGWWIKQAIKRALANQGKTIRLPIHLVDKLAKIRRIEASLADEMGREPTSDELAGVVGIPVKKLSFLKQAAQRPTSIHSAVGDDSSLTYAEVISDEKMLDPGEELISKTDAAELEEMLRILNQREADIVSARFGLTGSKAQTLEQVSKTFGVSRERIRQIQNVAIKKMRKFLADRNAVRFAMT